MNDEAMVEQVAEAIALDEARRDTGTSWESELGFWEELKIQGFADEYRDFAQSAIRRLRKMGLL